MRKTALRMILIILIIGMFTLTFNAGVDYVYGLEITGLHISDVSATRATVCWGTDVPATSQVEYGEDSDCNFSTSVDEALETVHQVRLTDLKPETTYYVRAKCRDAFEHEAVSGIYIFNTTGYEVPSQVKDVMFTNSTYQSVLEKPTGWFETGQEADIALNWFGFDNSGGPLMFNHPGGVATDGVHLVLADTWNNRILIWNILPEVNESPDVVLGQKDFNSSDSGISPDKLNWPVGVATDGEHLFVADTYNNRIMVWTEFPTENGEPADLVLGAPDFYTRGDSTGDSPREPKKTILWPWAVWTDGQKLVVTSTASASVLIWNNLPTEIDQPADIILAWPEIEFGTPRIIGSDGEHLVIGDHNAHVEGQNLCGNFFWREFPTTDNETYDFFIPGEYTSIWGCTFVNGKFMGLTDSLLIWDSFPEDADDEPDLTVNVDALTSGWGDGSSIAVADGRIYISLSNGNKIVAYNSLPTEPDQEPDFAVGAPNINTNTLATNYFIGNPVIASDGQHLFAISDFSGKMCVWKKLPDESGAKPDIVYTLDFAPWDIALHNGTLVIGGKNVICAWDTLPLNGELPDLTIRSEIGSIEFRDISGVALDDNYFYVSDMEAGEIYVWEGIPRESRDPKYIISVGPFIRILSSDGEHLAVTSFGRQSVYIYSIEGIPRNEEPIVLNEMEGGIRFNLPEGVFVDGEHLFVADTVSSRVLIWNNIPTTSNQPPDIVLGEDDFEDRTPEAKKYKLFWPKGIWFDGSFLWVGEFKFSNRLLRFSVSEEISYDDGEIDGSWAYGGCGHAVRFSPPNMSWTIDKVKIYGQWYGEDSAFTVELWNENKSTLQEIGPYNYSEFFSSSWEWVTIDIPDIKVNGDFYACFFADTRPEYGVSVGYDADSASNRSFIAFATHDLETFEYNWMIRVRGTSDITAPAISILSPENKTYATSSIPLTFTVNEATSWIGYSLDSQENVTIAGNTTLTGLLEGTYSLVIYANDTVGNMGSSSTVCFTINQTQTFHIVLGSIDYMVTMRSNSTITDFVFNQTLTQVSFNVNGTHGAVGFCNVTIAKSLLDGNPWTITIEGESPIDFIPSDNVTHSFLYFTYMHTSTLHVIIQGTWVVPEFPSLISLPLFMIATLLAVIIYRRKHSV